MRESINIIHEIKYNILPHQKFIINFMIIFIKSFIYSINDEYFL